MTDIELRSHIERLRSALDLIEEGASLEPPTADQLQALSGAVDDVRRTVWAGLVAEHSGEYPAYLGKVRIRRAEEICWSVTEDLKQHGAPSDVGPLETLRTTVRDLIEALGVIRP